MTLTRMNLSIDMDRQGLWTRTCELCLSCKELKRFDYIIWNMHGSVADNHSPM